MWVATKLVREKMAAMKVIIDCDAGVDDAQAIILALSQPSVQILAITCVSGNTNVDQVCVNVLKVLELCERTDIPVYRGASVPLMGVIQTAEIYHGADGLGGAEGIKDPDMSLLKSEHAVDALVRLANEHSGEVTLIALAPLTNIALVCRMDPTFPSKLKEVFIMGGNIEAKGNESAPCAEFNFQCDVESVHIVLNELVCPVIIVPLEVCSKYLFKWDFYDTYVGQESDKSRFMKNISAHALARCKSKGRPGFACYDALAVAVALKPKVVSKETSVYATVEMHGKFTTGQMVVDWRGVLQKEPNVKIVQEVHIEEFETMMMESVR